MVLVSGSVRACVYQSLKSTDKWTSKKVSINTIDENSLQNVFEQETGKIMIIMI